jgi:ATP-dependent Lhr-like helicase
MPLSPALGGELLEVLGQYAAGRATDPEFGVLQPLLGLQEVRSALPTRERLLVELLENREGFHVFVYPFGGRMLNEGAAALLALRAARESPATVAITANEYGFEILSATPLAASEPNLRRWLSTSALLPDLLATIDASDLARRQFRDIARIAGLVDPGTPRRAKTMRQLQASSGLMFDVLERHDAANLLLEQSRREVLEAQLAHTELAALLERMASQRFTIVNLTELSPLAFPLWADRLQTQTLSTETWTARVEREARRLERGAR